MNGHAKSRGKPTWRVVVVAQSVISTEGIAAILSRDSQFQLCAALQERESAEEAVALYRPDVVLIEPVVEAVDGFRLIAHIAARSHEIPILVISEHTERVYAERAIRAGASGYFVKGGSAQDLLRAIETVLSKSRVGSSTASQDLNRSGQRGLSTEPELSSLSDRELEVFSLIAADHGVGRISKQLGISHKTVETHCEHIKLKLNYANAKELKQGARASLGTR